MSNSPPTLSAPLPAIEVARDELSVSRSSSERRKRAIVPLNQRKRVKLACHICRRNKLKCNGQNPCQRCKALKKPCQYLDQESTRSLSRRHTPSNHSDDDRLSLLDDLFRRLHPDISTDLETLRKHAASIEQSRMRESDSRENDMRENSCQTNKDSAEAKDNPVWEREAIVLKTNSTHATTIIVHNQGKTHFDGGSSHWAFFDGVREAVTGGEAAKTTNDEEISYQHFISDSSLNFSFNDDRTSVLAALPPREVVDFLVTTFFSFAQANFFYIHPEIFSRKLNAFYTGSQEFDLLKSSTSRRSAEFTCVLFMVLAIGSQFAELEPGADSHQSDDLLFETSILETSKIKIPSHSPNPGWQFYEMARRLLPDVVSSSSMTSVQGCALQGTFLLSTNARDVSYNVMGLALRMAVNMGMHRSVSTNKLHPHVRELRNRLWWSIYSAERVFSIEMGRPLAIDDAEIDAPFPVDLPGLRIAGQPSNIDNQIAMASLCHIMGRIVKMVYSNKITSRNGQVIHPEPFKKLRLDLDQWKSRLPEHLKLSNTCTRAVAHLHLTCEQSIILLTRTCLNHAVANKHISQVSSETVEFLHQNAQDCLSAAKSSIRILSMLKDRSLLARFSFHDFLYCSAALYVLLLGAKLEAPDQTLKSSFTQGMSILLELAKGSEAAASSLRLISRGFQSCLREQSSTSQNPSESFDQGRKAWQEWMSRTIPLMSPSPRLASEYSPLPETFATPPGRWQEGPNQERRAEEIEGAAEFGETMSIAAMLSTDNHSDTLDAQSFWLPDLENDYNLLSRDLADAPSLQFFNQYDFSSLGSFRI